jgi:hypothetical protein
MLDAVHLGGAQSASHVALSQQTQADLSNKLALVAANLVLETNLRLGHARAPYRPVGCTLYTLQLEVRQGEVVIECNEIIRCKEWSKPLA